MEKEILQLEKEINLLKEWRDAIVKERLKFPIDVESRKILNYGNIVYTGNTRIANTNLGTDLLCFGLGIIVDREKRFVFASYPLFPFSASYATNVLTATDGSHNLKNGDVVALTSTDTLPDGLNTITNYYIIERTGTTFKLSLSSGGSEIDLIDNGTGTHYFGIIT